MADSRSGFFIPWGPTRGTPGEQATEKDITHVATSMLDKLKRDPNHRFAQQDREWIAKARAELERRKKAPAERPNHATAKPTTELANLEAIVGAFIDAGEAQDALREADKVSHLIAPARTIGSLPDGCEIYLTHVPIDPVRDVYTITGNRKQPSPDDEVGLKHTALVRIANAAGASWVLSRRTDDRRDPHFCAWEAVLEYKLFDGSLTRAPGNVEIDARDGGADYVDIVTKAAARKAAAERKREHYDGDGGERQVLELRKFLTRHAESKAMNRAIAKMGAPRVLVREQLQMPFIVASLAVTGRARDPQVRRELAVMKFQQLCSATSLLYGVPERPALVPVAPALDAPSVVKARDLWEEWDEMNREEPSQPRAAAQASNDTRKRAAGMKL